MVIIASLSGQEEVRKRPIEKPQIEKLSYDQAWSLYCKPSWIIWVRVNDDQKKHPMTSGTCSTKTHFLHSCCSAQRKLFHIVSLVEQNKGNRCTDSRLGITWVVGVSVGVKVSLVCTAGGRPWEIYWQRELSLFYFILLEHHPLLQNNHCSSWCLCKTTDKQYESTQTTFICI